MLRIQQLCREKGITMQDLAMKLGITYQSLYDSIKGNPTLRRLTDIASVLDVDVTELFDTSKEGVIRCPHCGKPIAIDPKII